MRRSWPASLKCKLKFTCWVGLLWHHLGMQILASPRIPAPPPAPLQLAPVPKGFSAVDDFDGSLCYEDADHITRKLQQARVSVMAVRHGQAESNAQSEALGEPLLYGQSESPLTEKGRQQAHQCSVTLYQQLGGEEWLAQALADPKKLPVLVGSDMSRAQETAEILKQDLAAEAERLAGPDGRHKIEEQLQIFSDRRLRETHFGTFERHPLSELQRAYPEFVSHWRPAQGLGTDFRHRFPGGESRADVMGRMQNFLEGCCLRFPSRTVIIVSHGETLLSTRTLLGKAPSAEGKVGAETGAIPNATPFWLVHESFDSDLPSGARTAYELE